MLLPIYHSHPPFSSRTLDSSSASPFSLPPPLKPLCCLSPRFSPKTPELLSKSAIQRITEKLQSLGYVSPDNGTNHGRLEAQPDSPGEIFISRQLPARRVGHTIDDSWSSPDHPQPLPGAGPAFANFFKIKRELNEQMRREKELAGREKRAPAPTLAELTIPEAELRRLRSEGIRLEKRLKVGKAGVTEGIVNGIHERWRRSELVKIKCEDLCRMNMKRTHETLERKTGGLVIWRSGSIIVLYRGANYKYPYFVSRNDREDETAGDALPANSRNGDNAMSGNEDNPSLCAKSDSSSTLSRPSLVPGVGSPNRVRFSLPAEMQLEEEADRLLDGLGPRFTDWWGYNPLPVDADLLPAFVPGYRRPFRLLPYGVKPKLTDREMTVLRRLGRPLPCHFALGRNRNLQGLAVAMIKLWEKCEIAKIAVKRGVQNTNSDMMAEELKRLTGGTLLSRDKEFIVFYRGKDFLPPAVSAAMEERRKNILSTQTEGEGADKNSLSGMFPEQGPSEPTPVSEIHATYDKKEPIMEQKELRSTPSIVESMEARLTQAITKKTKAEKLLEKLEKSANLRTPEVDKEGISEEERYMLRKVGLRMKAFLLLGRRGVFDGTIENMHLHWKYRELVKVICKDRTIDEVHRAALTLEAESGGILVAVERVNKGHAIIVYRGKNYQRPPNLRPKTLLNKREALKRSLEAQRQQSLKLHVLKLASDIDDMKLELVKEGMMASAYDVLEIDEPSGVVESCDNQVDIVDVDDPIASSLIEFSDVSGDTQAPTSTNESTSYNQDVDDPMANSLIEFSDVNKAPTSTNESVSDDVDDPIASPLIEFSDVAGDTEVPTSTNESVSDDSQIPCLPEYKDHLGQVEDNSSSASDELKCRGSYQMSGRCFNNIVRQDSAHVGEAVIIAIKDTRELSFQPCDSGSETEESVAVGPLRSAPLSNRERLLLRRQALKMKKRPVLAIGRNNVITGVAKTIKTHFQKNPLAIVNIKGRAKGTSIQELVFRLEQATGSVLVSQEPNKVILYRGWGQVEEHTRGDRNGRPDVTSVNGGEARRVSPELMAAIRLECGLQTGPDSGEVGNLAEK